MSDDKPFEGEFGNLGSFVRGRGGDGVVHVTVIGPHYQEEEIGPEAMAAFEKLAAGARRVMGELRQDDPMFGRPAYIREPTCRLCGLPGDLERSQYGWVHEACLTADDTGTDYEALGYPETKVLETNIEHPFWLAAHVGNLSGEWAASMVRIFEKDIRAATDNG
jgi:hypothetical protein